MRHQLFRVVFAVLGTALAFSASLKSAPPTENQKDNHGYLGVMIAPGAEGQRGVVVRDVAPGSPAAKAGLKSGDRIIKVGDQEPKDIEGFMKAVAVYKPGDRVKLMINRDGKEQMINAALGKRPNATAQRPEGVGRPEERGQREDGRRAEIPGTRGAQGPAYIGVTIQPLTDELRQQMKVEAKQGVVIVDVSPNSPAEKAGLKHGDVVTGVGGHAIQNPDDLSQAVQNAGAGKQITLEIARGNEKMKIKATPQTGTVGYFGPREGQLPSTDGGPMLDQSRRIRELERRVSELEKRIRDMEHRPGAQK